MSFERRYEGSADRRLFSSEIPITYPPSLSRAQLASFLNLLPSVDFAFAYGSRVFQQPPVECELSRSFSPGDSGISSGHARCPCSSDGNTGSSSSSITSRGSSSSARFQCESRDEERSQDQQHLSTSFRSSSPSTTLSSPPSSSSVTPPPSSSMVDFILAVDDPQAWHAENLRHNHAHYSSLLATFGSRAIVAAADRVGVGVHFNPFVPYSPLNQVKYGVIATAVLQSDLATWQHLYISGRLHKPVEILIPHEPILSLQSHNLRAAVAAALLLLPSTFTEHELYEQICRLSYSGDVRMALAEDPNKIRRIVSGGFHHFCSLYRSALQHFTSAGCLSVDSIEWRAAAKQANTKSMLSMSMQQEASTSSRRFLLQHLPGPILASLSHHFLPSLPYTSTPPFSYKTVSHSISNIDELSSLVRNHHSSNMYNSVTAAALSRRLGLSVPRKAICAELAAQLSSRVRMASARQAVAGVLAAGPAHAMRYLLKKVAKAWVKG